MMLVRTSVAEVVQVDVDVDLGVRLWAACMRTLAVASGKVTNSAHIDAIAPEVAARRAVVDIG